MCNYRGGCGCGRGCDRECGRERNRGCDKHRCGCSGSTLLAVLLLASCCGGRSICRK